MLSYSLPFIGHCRPCNSRADSYLSHIVSFLFHAQNTHQIISPGLRRTLWLVPSWSLMNSGQSSSNSCPMFRIAEITWLQGLSRWAIRDDLEEKSTTPSKIFDSYHLFRYLLIPYTEVGWSLTPLHSWTFTRCNFEKSPNLTSAIGPRVLKIFSFTASCNSWRAFFYIPLAQRSIKFLRWSPSVEPSPSSSPRCRSPRPPEEDSASKNIFSNRPGCSPCPGPQTHP